MHPGSIVVDMIAEMNLLIDMVTIVNKLEISKFREVWSSAQATSLTIHVAPDICDTELNTKYT